jgi:ssDNA-binding replication factor A large subunit
MVARHSPAQQLREAQQIAKDYNLRISENLTRGNITYFVWRLVFNHKDVFIGKTTSPARLRAMVERAASTH